MTNNTGWLVEHVTVVIVLQVGQIFQVLASECGFGGFGIEHHPWRPATSVFLTVHIWNLDIARLRERDCKLFCRTFLQQCDVVLAIVRPFREISQLLAVLGWFEEGVPRLA